MDAASPLLAIAWSQLTDNETIPAGVDFREYLHNAVRGCDALLAVIGEDWLVDRHGNRRLDEPRDFVRIEIEGQAYQFDRRRGGEIRAEIPAIVAAVHVAVGDRVEAGQLLVEMTSTEEHAQLEEALQAKGPRLIDAIVPTLF